MSNVEKMKIGITTAANPMGLVQTKLTVTTKGETINDK